MLEQLPFSIQDSHKWVVLGLTFPARRCSRQVSQRDNLCLELFLQERGCWEHLEEELEPSWSPAAMTGLMTHFKTNHKSNFLWSDQSFPGLSLP